MNGRDVSGVFTITLKSMRFHARVGLLPRERETPQPIDIDVSVSLNAAAQRVSDGGGALPDLDYRDVYEIVRQTLNGHNELLEQITQRISDRLLDLPGVTATRVAVRKPLVPLPGPLEYAEVVLERGGRA